MINALFFQRYNARGAVHVALHKMAAETPIRRNGALEINAAFLAQGLQVCPVESFLEQVETELFAAMGHDRQAATIDRYAVAHLDSLGNSRRDDLKLGAPAGPMDSDDAADFFNQTGKHNLRRRLFLQQLTSTASNRNHPCLFPKKQDRDHDENWRQHWYGEFES